ncbi:MAG: glycosyltransferase family 2 protein [Gemmataceae bacterium]|nr:glycosyltransferase family 2 protein [Gemmataceae bacterium]
MTITQRLFSLVVPVLNEEDVIADTYARLNVVLEKVGLPFEVIVVDNGSTDRTPQICAALCAQDARWKYMRLSRNFGYQNSITAGQLAARGDAIMVIDADLQDPPELIPEFIAKWREGYDVVYGVRNKREGESRLRVIPTMLAMRFISWMSDEVKLPLHSGDFRLITRRVRDAFAQMPETNRYVRGMFHWLGYRQIGIAYVRQGRRKGCTKVNPLFLLEFTWNAICSCSHRPLRFFAVLGLSMIAVCCGLGLLTLIGILQTGEAPISGFTLLLFVILTIQCAGFGVLGEYIGRIHAASKGRPLWLVDYTLNFEQLAVSQDVQGESQARAA